MAYQILSTKLYNPPLQARFVPRSTLIQRLEHGVQQARRLTLVSAPAGFGKTTLISGWMAASEPPKCFGWVSLDAGDNDPIRFLVYLVAALQKADGALGQETLASLQSPAVPPLPELVEALINAIAAAARPVLLVLDDYHLITNREVHTLTQLILERQPAFLHMVIITREDPPLPLPRMRVHGQLTEIRERDLRFTNAETARFFHQTMGLQLAAPAVAALERQTEGWVAGLQLAAIALQEYGEEQGVHAFVTTFAGNDRYIADYLVSEVLLHQPEAVRTFLIATSILERMCGPLCDAILKDEGRRMKDEDSTAHLEGAAFIPHPASFILDQLERANMFLIPLDNRREWYRYHHLFAELLQHTLDQTPTLEPTVLHRRASSWYEQHGFLQEAVHHAVNAQDWTFTAELVERHAMDLINQTQVVLLQQWIERVPKPIIQARPGLSIFHAWVLMLSFRADLRPLVREKLVQAEQALHAQEHPPLLAVGQGGALVPLGPWVNGQVAAIRSQLLLASFTELVEPHEVISLSVRSLELLPEGEQTVRSICAMSIAHGYLMLGDVANVNQAFLDARELALKADSYLSIANTYFYLARVAYLTGDLDRAFAVCEQGLATLRPRFANPEQEFPAIRSLYVMQALILLERGDLAEAQRLLELATNRTGYAPWVELIAYEALVRLWELQRDGANVLATLERMATMGPQIGSCAEALHIRHLTSRNPEDAGVRSAAAAWSEAHVPRADTFAVLAGIGPYQVDAVYIIFRAWLEVQIALGQYQAALDALTPILIKAEERGIIRRIHELSLLKVQAIKAGAAQARALGSPAPQTTRPVAAPVKIEVASPPTLLDPLSEREVEVLRLLALGLTLAEVGDRLCLSPYTVKAHTQNIYAKLDAHNRVEATNKARELGLIS